MPLVEHDYRVLITGWMRRGVITMSEAADLAGTSRVTALRWCRGAGFDPHVRRRAYLRSLMARSNWSKVRERQMMRDRGAESVNGGDVDRAFWGPPRRRIAKTDARASAEDAVKAYLDRGGTITR